MRTGAATVRPSWTSTTGERPLSERAALPPIAYQGEAGAYGEEAIVGYFGPGTVAPEPRPTFTSVCATVQREEAAGAVLPLENSIAGTVGEAVDALLRTTLVVRAELLLPVRHRLLGTAGASLATIRRVTSQRQALAQCEAFLARHPWDVVVADDTAAAARRLAESGDAETAVIASERAARRYGLKVLASDLQGGANLTRFAVVSRPGGASLPHPAGPLAPRSDARPVSLVVFESRDVAGALHDALGAFAEAGVNLTRIESRPTGGRRWEYRFIVSVEGHADEEPLRSGLAELRRRAHAVRVLGSFPSAS